jgi:hypothetical protein
MRARHLAGRFARALWPGRPALADETWAATMLTPREVALLERLPNHDRRHAIATARRVECSLAGTEHAGDARWLEAALTHDVGKWDAHLGPYGRAVATVAGLLATDAAIEAWTLKRGITRRAGLYLRHGELGAEMIRLAGGTEAAAEWAATHHHPGEFDRLPIPRPVVDALDAADNE